MGENPKEKFRNAMTKYRKEKSFTKTQLASIIGKSVSMICDIEAGRKNPSISTMVSIAIALNISLDNIFLN
jgi:DNA-binding XRE family transcriptional regulator